MFIISRIARVRMMLVIGGNEKKVLPGCRLSGCPVLCRDSNRYSGPSTLNSGPSLHKCKENQGVILLRNKIIDSHYFYKQEAWENENSRCVDVICCV